MTDDVKALLDDPGGSKSAPDVISSRPQDCDRHGSCTELVTKVKLGRGSYMLVPSRCPGCLREEQEASKKYELWLASLKPATPEWSRR